MPGTDPTSLVISKAVSDFSTVLKPVTLNIDPRTALSGYLSAVPGSVYSMFGNTTAFEMSIGLMIQNPSIVTTGDVQKLLSNYPNFVNIQGLYGYMNSNPSVISQNSNLGKAITLILQQSTQQTPNSTVVPTLPVAGGSSLSNTPTFGNVGFTANTPTPLPQVPTTQAGLIVPGGDTGGTPPVLNPNSSPQNASKKDSLVPFLIGTASLMKLA